MDNEITGNWKINTLLTRNVIYEHPNYQNDADDYTEQFDHVPIETDFKIIADEIDSIGSKVLNTRSANMPNKYSFDYLKIEGSLDVKGPSNIDSLFVVNLNEDKFNDLVEDCAKYSIT